MKDCDERKCFRHVAMPLMMMTLFLCSFQCTDALGLFVQEDPAPKIELLKKKDVPVWPVYPASENLPSTNILFVVWSLSEDLDVWAECPQGDLEVSVTPVCARYTLSVSATDDFSGPSSVKIISRDGNKGDELEIRIEPARILPEENVVMAAAGAYEYHVPVDTNMGFYAKSYDEWITVQAGPDKVNISVAENETGSSREGRVKLYDIYEVVTAEITVKQMP